MRRSPGPTGTCLLGKHISVDTKVQKRNYYMKIKADAELLQPQAEECMSTKHRKEAVQATLTWGFSGERGSVKLLSHL